MAKEELKREDSPTWQVLKNRTSYRCFRPIKTRADEPGVRDTLFYHVNNRKAYTMRGSMGTSIKRVGLTKETVPPY
jgi:hypothetical protein